MTLAGVLWLLHVCVCRCVRCSMSLSLYVLLSVSPLRTLFLALSISLSLTFVFRLLPLSLHSCTLWGVRLLVQEHLFQRKVSRPPLVSVVQLTASPRGAFALSGRPCSLRYSVLLCFNRVLVPGTRCIAWQSFPLVLCIAWQSVYCLASLPHQQTSRPPTTTGLLWGYHVLVLGAISSFLSASGENRPRFLKNLSK